MIKNHIHVIDWLKVMQVEHGELEPNSLPYDVMVPKFTINFFKFSLSNVLCKLK